MEANSSKSHSICFGARPKLRTNPAATKKKVTFSKETTSNHGGESCHLSKETASLEKKMNGGTRNLCSITIANSIPREFINPKYSSDIQEIPMLKTSQGNHGVIDCNLVYPGIYIGNGCTIADFAYLKKIEATHVINTSQGDVTVNGALFPRHEISYFGFHVEDHPCADITRFFERTIDYMERALAFNGCSSCNRRKRGTLVVNCVKGWSRSVSIVVAFLIAKRNFSFSGAINVIKQHRPLANPNVGFVAQLLEYERACKMK